MALPVVAALLALSKAAVILGVFPENMILPLSNIVLFVEKMRTLPELVFAVVSTRSVVLSVVVIDATDNVDIYTIATLAFV